MSSNGILPKINASVIEHDLNLEKNSLACCTQAMEQITKKEGCELNGFTVVCSYEQKSITCETDWELKFEIQNERIKFCLSSDFLIYPS